jgi:UPF0755 protein
MQPNQPRRSARRLGLVVLALVLVSAGLSVAALVYHYAYAPYQGWTGSELFVDIPAGSSTQTIGRTLVDNGLVHDRLSYRIALWLTGSARRLKAGEYRFDRAMTPSDVLEKLARGDVFLRPITFPEGLTIPDMARIYEERGLGAAAEFIAAASDPTPIADLDPVARDLEGYLFPET